MNASLCERVRATVAATLSLPLSAITMETSAENNDTWDSLAQVNLMLAVEQAFAIEFEVEDFMSLTSVQSIVGHLEALGLT